jgi:hypothetical protein
MAYRDDRDGLRIRRAELQKELAEVEFRLASSPARRSTLDDIRIASPCHMSWDSMTGDDSVRFCHACEKNVYNLSTMAREEGEWLLREREGQVCLRLYRRADGTVLTSDCQVGARARWTRRRALGAALGVGAATATSMAAVVGQVGSFHPGASQAVDARDEAARAADQRAHDIARGLETQAGSWSVGMVSSGAPSEELEGLDTTRSAGGSSYVGGVHLSSQPRKDGTR